MIFRSEISYIPSLTTLLLWANCRGPIKDSALGANFNDFPDIFQSAEPLAGI
jgi:hypothetical protein